MEWKITLKLSLLESEFAAMYLVGVNVEFLPLAVRFLFVGGTNTIPPGVIIVTCSDEL